MEKYKRCTAKNADGKRCEAIGVIRYESLKTGGRCRCLCEFHAAHMDGYGQENKGTAGNVRKMKDIRRKQSFSIENETMCPTTKAYGVMQESGFRPSHDGTVDCEFKSPIFESGKPAFGALATIQKLKDNGDIAITSECGTHLHIGLIDKPDEDTPAVNLMANYMPFIRRFYNSLFYELSQYLMALPDKGACVFGRPLGGEWAKPITMSSDAMAHKNFINVEHSFSLEFRQCFFKDKTQYARAMRVCRRWHEAVIAWAMAFDENLPVEEKRASARKVSEKCIAEYQRANAEGMRYDIGK